MILRGQVPENQLEFDLEIERAARKNRSRKRREQQSQTREESFTTFDRGTQVIQEEVSMAEVRIPLPRRTLGDYALQQGLRHFSSIAVPATTKVFEMKPTFLNLISSHQFTGMDNEDPYAHLSTFYELIGTMGVKEAVTETVYMRLFPFSLVGRAKE